MTIQRRQEFPYPRNLRSLADIEKYLKSLHVALSSSQSSLTEIVSNEFNMFSEEILGTTNQIIVTDNHPTNITLSAPQDIHSGASPTFVTAKLSALTNGYLPYHVSGSSGLANSPLYTDGVSTATIRNNTDSAVDPVIQFAVGATPSTKFTMGVDDSDSDSFQLCAGSSLGASQYVRYTDGILNLKHGPAYDAVLNLKHSTVAHGITDYAETDTYLAISTNPDASWIGTSTQGGPWMLGFSEGEIVFGLHAFYTTGVTDRTFPMAPFTVFARKKSGTGEGSCVADEAIMTAAHGPGSSFTPDWTAMVGGGTWQSGVGTASRYVSTVAIGTAPFSPTSTTVCPNLNADLWDGYQFSDYLNQAVRTTDSPVFVTVKLSGLTDGYVPYHVSDAAGLANGPIRTDGSTIGIGAEQSAVSMLTVGPISVPQWGGSAIYAWGPTRAVASNETNFIEGMSFNSYFASIASGITDSGYRTALNLASYIVDSNFKGTLASQYGAHISYGIAEAGTSGERTVTNSYGLYLSGYDYEGTITNKWGVYQVNTNFKNYFEGQIQSAVASGTAPFIVASPTRVPNLNADLLDGNEASAFLTSVTAHQLDGALHTVSGLTSGHFLKATGAATFGFAAHGLTYSDVGAEVSGAVATHEGTYNHANYNTAYGWGDHSAEGYLTSVTAHDLLSATHGDTTAAAVSRGAMIAGIGATPKWTAIAAGTEGYVWTMGANEPGWAAAAGGGAPTDAQYVCLAVNGSLSAERVLTGTANQITITDNGANGTVVLSTPQDIHSGAAPTFAGLTVDTDTISVDATNHRVGIGTTTPDDDLQIYANNGAMNFGTRGVNGNWCRIKANADQGYAEFTTGFGSWWYTLNSPTDDARFVISRLAAQVVAMRGGYDGNQGKNITLVVQGGTYGSVDGANLYLRGGYSSGAVQGQVKVQSSDGNTNYMTFLTDGKVGINDDSPAEYLDVNGNINVTGVYKVDDVQVVGPRVVDARCDDAINSGDATTDGVIDALRDAMIAHGLIAAS